MLKQVQRPAKVSWGPVKQCSSLLAAGGVGVNFEKSQLEIYDVNLAETSSEMTLLGSVQTSDCFQSIAWGAKGIEDRTLSHGIVAGGMSDGSINFWNAAAIIKKTESLLSRAAGHKSPVLDMSFHPAQVNLLASASASGEVFVWDIQQPSAPSFSNDHQQSGPVSTNAVCALDWNWKVHRILASANDVGETTIWDLRQKKGIMSLKQQYSKHRGARQRDRATGLAWQPGREVNVAVSYQSPVIEIWDMRYPQGPKQQLDGAHASSVLGIDWCPHDNSLLLSTGDDGRTFVWDAMAGTVLSEYMNDGVNSDIDYSPFMPGVVSTCNYDGMINIYSYNHTGPNHVPKWLGAPVGSSIGFGGKVVSFGLESKAEATPTPSSAAAGADGKQQPLPSPQSSSSKRIHINQIDSEPLLTQLSNQFLQQMHHGDWNTFCEEKMAAATDEAERTEWKFMKILLSEDKTSQCSQLVLELGFQVPSSSSSTQDETKLDSDPHHSHHHQQQQQHNQQHQQHGSPHSDHPHSRQQQQPLTIHAPPDYNENDESFFDNFVVPEHAPIAATSETKAATTNANGELVDGLLAAEAKETDSANGVVEGIDADSEEDDVLRRALIVGDWKSAVARAIELDRIADALVFASCAGMALWESTRAMFFKKHSKPFIRNVVKLLVVHDLGTLVQDSDLKKWKETLAILLTYSTGEERDGLVNTLAYRLEQQSEDTHHAALLCYLCSSNVDRVVSLWSRPSHPHSHQQHQQQHDGKQKEGGVIGLHHVIEKITVLAQATQSANSPLLAAKYCEYAALLASQGCMPAAMTFLSAAKADDECNAVLLDRLFRAQPVQYQNPAQAPPFPFHMKLVGVDPEQAQALAADAHQRAQAELYKQQQHAQSQPFSQGNHLPYQAGGNQQPHGFPPVAGAQGGHGHPTGFPQGGGAGGAHGLPGSGITNQRRTSLPGQPAQDQQWPGGAARAGQNRGTPGRTSFDHGGNFPPAAPNNSFPPSTPGGFHNTSSNTSSYQPNTPHPTSFVGGGTGFPPSNVSGFPPNTPANIHPTPFPGSSGGNRMPPAFPDPTPSFPGSGAHLPLTNFPKSATLPPHGGGFDNGRTDFSRGGNIGGASAMGSGVVPPSLPPRPFTSSTTPSNMPILPGHAGPTPGPFPSSDTNSGNPTLPGRGLPSRLPPSGLPPTSAPLNDPYSINNSNNSNNIIHKFNGPSQPFTNPNGFNSLPSMTGPNAFPSARSSNTMLPSSAPVPLPSPSRPTAQTQKVPLPLPRPVGPSVGGDGRAMAATLTQLADQLDNDPAVKPLDKKKLPEVRKKLADLTSRVEANALSPNALGLLNTLVQAMTEGNMLAAQQAHTKLVTDEFKDNQVWLPGVKTLMLMYKKR